MATMVKIMMEEEPHGLTLTSQRADQRGKPLCGEQSGHRWHHSHRNLVIIVIVIVIDQHHCIGEDLGLQPRNFAKHQVDLEKVEVVLQLPGGHGHGHGHGEGKPDIGGCGRPAPLHPLPLKSKEPW